mgnify:CR=1 FL=1
MNTMAPIEKMWENVLTLEQGQLLDLKEIQAALIRMGYRKRVSGPDDGTSFLSGAVFLMFFR